jgi:hypothetical protein
MLIDSIKGEQDTVDLLLQIAGRTAVIVASALMVFFDKEPFHAVASAAMLLLEVSVYNIAAAVYGRNQLRSGRSRKLALWWASAEATIVHFSRYSCSRWPK